MGLTRLLLVGVLLFACYLNVSFAQSNEPNPARRIPCVTNAGCPGLRWACCAGACINTNANVCINGTVCPRGSTGLCKNRCYSNKEATCINNSTLCPAGSIGICAGKCFKKGVCFNNTLCPPASIGLCAGRCYTAAQTCVGNSTLCPAGSTGLCGGKCYSSANNTCVGNSTLCPFGSNALCGGTCYNSSQSGCYNGTLLCRIGWNVCGSTCYDPKLRYCPNGIRLCNKTEWYCAESDSCYNPKVNSCCAAWGKLCPRPRTTMVAPNNTSNRTCCSKRIPARGCSLRSPLRCDDRCYNGEISACFNEEVVCRHGSGLCGTRCFNPERMYCPDSKTLCFNTQWFCSEAGKCFDPKTHYCCSSLKKVCRRGSKNCCPA